MSRCIRYRVSGKVQGVFYRASAQARARELGLQGYARNLDDGSVEVLACGEPERLDEFRQWLRQGPPRAQVTDVEDEPVLAPPALDGFSVR